MTREELKKLGLSDEAVDAVMKLHGTATEDLKSANAKVANLTEDLKSANAQIATLNDTISKSENVDDLKAQMSTLKTEYEKQIETMKYDHEVDNYLSSVKFSNDLVKKAVTSEFKEKGFKLSDGKLLGADDYINELKKSQPNAFAEEKPEGAKPAGVKIDGVSTGAGDNNPPAPMQKFF